MTGCVSGANPNAYQRDISSVAQEVGLLQRFGGISPLAAALAREMQRSAGSRCQGPGAGDEIGVDVRLGDVSDAHAISACRTRVHADVRVGVDDDRVSRLLAGDQVTPVRQVLVVESSEEHWLDERQ
jgi:hypothetical protein